jgi:hypothetical protein
MQLLFSEVLSLVYSNMPEKTTFIRLAHLGLSLTIGDSYFGSILYQTANSMGDDCLTRRMLRKFDAANILLMPPFLAAIVPYRNKFFDA